MKRWLVLFLAISCCLTLGQQVTNFPAKFVPPIISSPIYLDANNHVLAPGTMPYNLLSRGVTNMGPVYATTVAASDFYGNITGTLHGTADVAQVSMAVSSGVISNVLALIASNAPPANSNTFQGKLNTSQLYPALGSSAFVSTNMFDQAGNAATALASAVAQGTNTADGVYSNNPAGYQVAGQVYASGGQITNVVVETLNDTNYVSVSGTPGGFYNGIYAWNGTNYQRIGHNNFIFPNGSVWCFANSYFPQFNYGTNFSGSVYGSYAGLSAFQVCTVTPYTPTFLYGGAGGVADGGVLTNLNPANIIAGSADIDISGNAATASSLTGNLPASQVTGLGALAGSNRLAWASLDNVPAYDPLNSALNATNGLPVRVWSLGNAAGASTNTMKVAVATNADLAVSATYAGQATNLVGNINYNQVSGAGTAGQSNAAAFDLAGVGASKAQQATNGLPVNVFSLGTASQSNSSAFYLAGNPSGYISSVVLTGPMTNNLATLGQATNAANGVMTANGPGFITSAGTATTISGSITTNQVIALATEIGLLIGGSNYIAGATATNSFYPSNNPSGFQTAAQVASASVTYATTAGNLTTINTNLITTNNASQLTSGTVALNLLPSGVVTNNSTVAITNGVGFVGNGSTLTNLNAWPTNSIVPVGSSFAARVSTTSSLRDDGSGFYFYADGFGKQSANFLPGGSPGVGTATTAGFFWIQANNTIIDGIQTNSGGIEFNNGTLGSRVPVFASAITVSNGYLATVTATNGFISPVTTNNVVPPSGGYSISTAVINTNYLSVSGADAVNANSWYFWNSTTNAYTNASAFTVALPTNSTLLILVSNAAFGYRTNLNTNVAIYFATTLTNYNFGLVGLWTKGFFSNTIAPVSSFAYTNNNSLNIAYGVDGTNQVVAVNIASNGLPVSEVIGATTTNASGYLLNNGNPTIKNNNLQTYLCNGSYQANNGIAFGDASGSYAGTFVMRGDSYYSWVAPGNGPTSTPMTFLGTAGSGIVLVKTNLAVMGWVLVTNTVTIYGLTTVSNNLNTVAQFNGSNSAWAEINVQNYHPAGSSDITATTDKGTAITNYINIGVNNSGYVPGSGLLGSTNDTYVNSVSGNEFFNIVGTGNNQYWTSQPTTNGTVTTNMILSSSGLLTVKGGAAFGANLTITADGATIYGYDFSAFDAVRSVFFNSPGSVAFVIGAVTVPSIKVLTTNVLFSGTVTATNGFNSQAPHTPVAVTVGASPFAFTNTTTIALECYFDGGTAYSVSKNTAAVYSSLVGSRYFVLQPSSTATITYTVAPTFYTNAW